MLITVREATAGLYGAFCLAKGDRGGLAWFDSSSEGAIRSFYAALVAFPIATLLLIFDLGRIEVAASTPKIAIVYTLAYALDWCAYPLAVHWLAPGMGCDANFLRYLPALNWSRVLELLALVPGALILTAGLGGLLMLIPVVLFSAVLVYHWFVAKVALDIPGPKAAGLVGLNLMLGLIISFWAQALIR